MDLPVSIRLTLLIRPDDFNFVPDPIWRQVYSTAVATGFDPLFDHLFTVYFEFNLIIESVADGFFLSVRALIAVLIFILWHVILPLPVTKLSDSFDPQCPSQARINPVLPPRDHLTGMGGIYTHRQIFLIAPELLPGNRSI